MSPYLIFSLGMMVGGCLGLIIAAILGAAHKQPEQPVDDWGKGPEE